MPSFPPRIFLLSPARLDGKRAHLLFHPVTMFPVARALHSPAGAPIGEIFTFLSGLYFRGKLAYAEAFARPPQGLNSGVFVITPNRGLLAPSVRVTLDDLARLAKTDIDPCAERVSQAPPAGRQGARAGAWPARRACSAGQHRHTQIRRCAALSLSAGASFPGGVRWSGRHEPWGSHASLRGCPPGTRLRAGAGSCPARRPATEAASSGDSILSQSLST